METLSNFVYEYYIRHQKELKQYSTPVSFYADFKDDKQIFQELNNYIRKDSVNIDGVSQTDKNQLDIRIKALLARLIWRSSGYYYVINQTDPVLKKAMELLENNNSIPASDKGTLTVVIFKVLSFDAIRQDESDTPAYGNQGKIDGHICPLIILIR